MKEQTESFYIDLEKVDRVKAEKVINAAGGVWCSNYVFRKTCKYLYYFNSSKDFYYSTDAFKSDKEITSLSELKKQLGLVPENFIVRKVSVDDFDKVSELAYWLTGVKPILSYDSARKEITLRSSCGSLKNIRMQDLFPEETEEEHQKHKNKMEEKEYVLNQDVEYDLDDVNIIFKKGTRVEFSHKINGESCFIINTDASEYPYEPFIFPEKYVEEKRPLLSDIIQPKQEIENIENYEVSVFLGIDEHGLFHLLSKTKTGYYLCDYQKNDFNKQFKLKD